MDIQTSKFKDVVDTYNNGLVKYLTIEQRYEARKVLEAELELIISHIDSLYLDQTKGFTTDVEKLEEVRCFVLEIINSL